MSKCEIKKMKTLADYPKQCIEIGSRIDPETAKLVLKYAYEYVLPEIDADYFEVKQAKIFKYPEDDFPTLKFWVGSITNTSRWYKEGNRVVRLTKPIRYNVDVDEM